MKILFLVPYPKYKAPSQRFRFEQYFNLIQEKGWLFTIQSFWDEKTWAILYQPGFRLQKMVGFTKGITRRLGILFRLSKIDVVFIHRECLPLGPPIIEWIIARLLRKKIIYDFDDAIWLTSTSIENLLVSKLKWPTKVNAICRWSNVVSCGNDYLVSYAKQFNHRVVFNPTTIDTNNYHNPALFPKPKQDRIIIGWTGTHSTLSYLDLIVPVIQSLEKKLPDRFEFRVIADKKPSLNLTSLRFVKWSKEMEIKDLLQFDIGIMPLTDNVWSKGKCGFKILQYMALGIPAIASAVGVNNVIIDEGVNGFLCESLHQWEEKIIRLIEDNLLRNQMGKAGRAKIVNNYSVDSNSKLFLSLFE